MKIINDYGTQVGITADGRLMLQQFRRPLALAEAMDKQRAYAFVEDAVTPTGADSVPVVIYNTAAEPLVIDKIVVNIASTEIVKVEVLAKFTPAGGAALTATNRTAGSGNTFATKGGWYGAVNVTGQVATPVEVHRVKLASGVDKVIDLSKAPIVLGQNQAMQIKTGTGTVSMSYAVYGYHVMIPRVNG